MIAIGDVSRTLADEAYSRIREAMHSGQLKPGQKLRFSDLQELTDTSVTPVREALARLKAVAADPLLPLANNTELKRLARLCADLQEEGALAREGYRLAMRGLLALIAIEVVRLGVSRARSGAVTLMRADARVEELRALLDAHFRRERQIGFYAGKLAMTPDRLNDHVKRATGVTAGHMIRQRVLTEAKRQLVFTNQPIHEIAYDLAFSDPSHFTRFFRKATGMTPQAFRIGRGG